MYSGFTDASYGEVRHSHTLTDATRLAYAATPKEMPPTGDVPDARVLRFMWPQPGRIWQR